MKLILKTADLKKALQLIITNCKQSPNPKYSGVFYLEIKEDYLSFESFNGDLTGLRTLLPINNPDKKYIRNVYSPDKFTLFLSSKLLPEEINLNINEEDGSLELKCKGLKLKTTCKLQEEVDAFFPSLSQSPLTIDAKSFLSKLSRAVFAIPEAGELTPVFQGFRFEEGCLLTTTGRTLSYQDISSDLPSGSFTMSKSVFEILKAQNIKETDELFFYILEDWVVLKTYLPHETAVYCRVITAPFVPYKQLIPDSFDCIFTAQKTEILDALQAMRSVASTLSERKNIVSLQVDNNDLTFSIVDEDVEKTIEINNITGSFSSKVHFNVNYLLEGVNSCPSSNIILNLNTQPKPSIITCDDWNYLLMPINIAP